ncbi:MAG: hypothetical protein ACXW4E_03295, partial [Anaerolineales bacterium]
MKKILLYMIIITSIVVGVVACQPAAATQPAAGPGGGQVSERCGDQSQLVDEIFLYTWVEYIDPAIKTQFEEECGVKVT